MYAGRPSEAHRLLREALEVARRESSVGFHLFDRIYGTALAAAADSDEAIAVLDEAELSIHGPVDTCPGCRITFAVPATIAAARAGDLERASGYLAAAEVLARVVMKLPAWNAAVEEARAHVALAGGDRVAATKLFRTAADGFRNSSQPLDAQRCAQQAMR